MFRKTKKGLVAVVAALSLSSMMAAMSYSSASVTSDMSISKAHTSGALLALEASDFHAAAGYKGSGNTDTLELNLDKGHKGEFGIQPNSTYQWDDLFKVTNNSEHEVKVTVKLDQKINKDGRITLNAATDSNNWTRIMSYANEGAVKELTFNLAPGASEQIDIKTAHEANGWVGKVSPKLIVEAEAVK